MIKMKSTFVLLLLISVTCLLVDVTNGQNAPGVNWQLVQPIHRVQSFFQDYPFLESLFRTYDIPTSPLAEGRNATRNQYPYQVGLVVNRGDGLGFCGGSLISTEWILTAAHCIDGVTSGTAFLGAFDLRNAGEFGQSRFAVTQFFVHPGWNGLRLADDIGLVRLPNPVVLTANIQTIRLANLRQISSSFLNQLALMSGWGRNLFSTALPQPPAETRFAQFHIMQGLACRLAYPGIIESGQFCSISTDPSGPMCPGDAGGPLVVIEADGNPTQIGVTTFITGLGCAANNRPSIFNRLNFYLSWISQVTNIVIAPGFVF